MINGPICCHLKSKGRSRDYFIDLLLKEAGWPLDQKRDREFPVTGMPNRSLSLRESSSKDERNFRGAKGDFAGPGFVDYVLWGDDGKPLRPVEAKRTNRSPRDGEHQAKLYADCLESMYGQRPILFFSNGHEHWIWDDQAYPPRRVQGFYKESELELLVQRRVHQPSEAAIRRVWNL